MQVVGETLTNDVENVVVGRDRRSASRYVRSCSRLLAYNVWYRYITINDSWYGIAELTNEK